jgi:tetratricopeptide (TPR) repeat protein
VEYNGGDLERIEHSLRRAGELTDDLSLLRLAYLEDSPLPATADTRITDLQDRARGLMSRREYAAAMPLYEELILEAPASDEDLFRAACVFKYAGATELAIDTGERVRLRTPDHVNNLVNLADAYRIVGNQARALELLAWVQERSPKTASIQKLEQLLNA